MPTRDPGRPLIVPIFIANQGCPHRCVFCQQEKITSQATRGTTPGAVARALEEAVLSDGFDPARLPEVAFYGGTFTGLAAEKMTALLEAVIPFLKEGRFVSIRVSTRPDALDRQRLEILKKYGVSTVELGAQSMDDGVLELSGRGHSAQDTVDAVALLRRHGFRVGIQLMPGLPGDSERTFMETVARVKALAPDMVRLYPTVVIRGTELARRYASHQYTPWGLEEALNVCKQSCIILEGAGIPVIRIGLMASPALLKAGEILSGPWHSAFGFLVRSAIHLERIAPLLPGRCEAHAIRLRVPPREIPLVRGYRNQGLQHIEKRCGARVVGVLPDESLQPGQIAVDWV